MSAIWIDPQTTLAKGGVGYGPRWQAMALGEVMLRFDPGEGRVRNARQFQVWEGGGEYNVARAMRKCWGKRAAVVTALPKNDLGWLVEDTPQGQKLRRA